MWRKPVSGKRPLRTLRTEMDKTFIPSANSDQLSKQAKRAAKAYVCALRDSQGEAWAHEVQEGLRNPSWGIGCRSHL